MSAPPTDNVTGAVFSNTPDDGDKTFGFWIVRGGKAETATPLPPAAKGIGLLGFKTRKLAQRFARDWKTLLSRADYGSADWRNSHAALLTLTLKHGPGENSQAAQALIGETI